MDHQLFFYNNQIGQNIWALNFSPGSGGGDLARVQSLEPALGAGWGGWVTELAEVTLQQRRGGSGREVT